MQRVDVKERARSRELRVLEQWRNNDTFKQSITNREGKPNFVFYEGPPTANGAPHIGHVLGRVIKDFICRYKTMSGYRVVRKAGWDTHGLPVELGVEKQLGISGKQEIENYGVEAFIKKCKASVFEYEKQWRELTEAIAYWTDMDNPYITLDNNYIESVWHLLSKIHQKGLLYRGHRVSPYCPCCQTTLSSHEVAQGYEDVKDLSATVKFKLTDSNEYVLAWTTTPWTLPANVALAVNPSLAYAKVKRGEETYVVAQALVESVFKDSEYEIVGSVKGADLVGKSYEPPFRYVAIEKGHIVIGAEFVSDTSGTGIVHIAPAHGDDDYKAARANGISMLSVVNNAGRYVDEVTDLAGRFVKDCDIDIVKMLSERGLLFSKEKYEHSYPFCWRCKSPLLYYATESWFIETTAVKDQLIKNNSEVDWYPGHIREGRFGKFLEDLVDWNISRNRYWGTPLNVWVCEVTGKEYAPSSIADLCERAVDFVPEDIELHKPYVDEIKLKSPFAEGAVMTRTSEVIDVWFDSGSMPFAQQHYPFSDESKFADQYPADIICEGIDQTRGWFFSLLAVSTLFNGKAPYKAVISTGHILDENGQKMSKSKGNVIDPWEIINEFGTDAFRWALLADSAPWNSKRFSRGIVAEAKSKVIDTIVNTHAFFALYATIDGFNPAEHPYKPSTAKLDRWIVSRLNSLITQVVKGLDANDFLNPAKGIEAFVDELSNWYIRRSRDRFWGSGLTEDKLEAYGTLRHVLVTLSRLIAPYAPLLADDVYGNLGGEGSVHLADFPTADESAIDEALERDMETARQIVELARNVRNETGIKTRQPLSELIVSLDRDFDVAAYEDIIKDEINVKTIVIENSDSGFVDFTLKLNLKVAGKKFGKNVGPIQSYLKELAADQTRAAVQGGGLTFTTAEGESIAITVDELLVEKQAKAGFASASGYSLTVALNTDITPELEQEGWVREVIRAVQDTRKKLDLPIEKRIDLVLEVDAELQAALQAFDNVLRENVLVNSVSFGSPEELERVELGGKTVGIQILK
ncbi:isoleucyl-tRNA synthetase [Paenibacillus cellulosilyticus]|uniref:Isoleucine--tRNA ligase n=1 Tax=Paenibacillus cellulosilyticus TaxID=375489 RepID=A0A2V2YC45_9BACL|nr:isoleucine--tRNA ligase [Paenibacillus cellulosilyticus]PWV89390.1 isoleucyl-tRNA synthetase [Paenibacillus cellulosilyticus]QKS43140.1 isoleucine--tRNA ligase [Paenibacillus cellulosilyticus]